LAKVNHWDFPNHIFASIRNPFQDILADGEDLRIRSRPKLVRNSKLEEKRDRSPRLFVESHLLISSKNFSFPPNGAVIVESFNFPGIEIILYTENKVNHQRTTLGVSFSISRLSRSGIKLGSPELVSRGRGRSGSTSRKDKRGVPPIFRCRATVQAFRYFTTNDGP